MAEATIEERLTNLEREVADMKAHTAPKKRLWERVGRVMDPELLAAHQAMEAYGKYWRKTGKEAPDDWKPGDPIPEPDWDAEDWTK